MRTHRLKIYPNSEAEKRFMELLKAVNVEPSSVMCRLGSVFGTEYNEYIFSEGLYNLIHNYLLTSEEA